MSEATHTLTLTDFLLARIADDEAWLAVPTAKRMVGRKVVHVPMERLPAHVERGRDRWALECRTKRWIAHLHGRSHECSQFDRRGDVDNCTWVNEGDACSTLRALAAVYSDHPDYRQEWAL